MLSTKPDSVLHGATDEIIEVEVETLGIEHLVRELSEEAAYDLAEKDESTWEPLEIRHWPTHWKKPSERVIYHVISGNHRTRAAQIKGLRTLRAKLVRAESEIDFLKTAIRSNTGHGRNFTREEYAANARRLHEEGMSLTEIAALLGYNKSTVSRWLTGSDSHAAAKREGEAQLMPSSEMPHVSGADAVKQKIMGLVMDGRIDADVMEARDYVASLKQTQQESLHSLFSWLQEVIYG